MKNILDFISNKFKTYDIFTLCGIPIRFNLSFLLVTALVLVSFGGNICLALSATVALFVSLLAHELGHCLAAKKYGYNTHDISLTVLGGCASLDLATKPMSPKEELDVAFAGPKVSFMLFGITSLMFLVLCAAIAWSNILATLASPLLMLLVCMFWLNLVLGLFNLIPAFPMDGGRIFRAWLAKKPGRSRLDATRIAIKTAKAIACVFGFIAVMNILLGNLGGLTLGLIAFFVWNAGEAELEHEEMLEEVNAFRHP